VDDPDERSAPEDAMARLRHTLGFGALDGEGLKRLARIEGIPERTLYRAPGALGVDRRAQGFGKARLWSMCAKTPMSASKTGLAEFTSNISSRRSSALRLSWASRVERSWLRATGLCQGQSSLTSPAASLKKQSFAPWQTAEKFGHRLRSETGSCAVNAVPMGRQSCEAHVWRFR
jgi:hypothetical protein